METCYVLKVDNTHIAIVDLVRPGELTSAWTITRINVPRDHRGRGIGRELLREVLAAADFEGVTLQLEVHPSDGLNYEQLEAWYKRCGFQRNRLGYMTRRPRAIMEDDMRLTPREVSQLEQALDSERIRECDWCGMEEPLVDSDTQESFPVLEYSDGHYHGPCHDSMNEYQRARDAFAGMARDRAEQLWELIRETLPEGTD